MPFPSQGPTRGTRPGNGSREKEGREERGLSLFPKPSPLVTSLLAFCRRLQFRLRREFGSLLLGPKAKVIEDRGWRIHRCCCDVCGFALCVIAHMANCAVCAPPARLGISHRRGGDPAPPPRLCKDRRYRVGTSGMPGRSVNCSADENARDRTNSEPTIEVSPEAEKIMAIITN